MKMPNRTAVLALVCAMLASCATPPGGLHAVSAGASDDDPCAVGGAAAIGAVLGAVVGRAAASRSNRTAATAAGAVIGAGAAALGCLTYNRYTQQTRTAQQVNEDYRRINGELPVQPSVVSYKAATDKPTAVRGRDKVTVTSRSVLVDGRSEKIGLVEEEIYAKSPDTGEWKALKAKSSQPGRSAGEYVNSFEFPTLPDQMPVGERAFRTELKVNGKPMANSSMSFNVVFEDGAVRTVLASK